jgi:hypothetical protein
VELAGSRRRGRDLVPSSALRRQLVGHKHARSKALLPEPFAHQLQSGGLVSPGSSLSTARHRDIRLPWIETTISSMCQRSLGHGRSRRRLRAKAGAKFDNLSPDRLVGDLQPPLDQKFLHIPVTQVEPEIKPGRVPDDLRRELVPAIGEWLHPPTLPRIGVTRQLFP